MACFRFQRRLPRPVASHRDATPAAKALAAVRTAAPHGAGWFESSWELVRGLIVREGLPDDPGLDEWLGAYLVDHLVDCPVEHTVPIGRLGSQRAASVG